MNEPCRHERALAESMARLQARDATIAQVKKIVQDPHAALVVSQIRNVLAKS